MRTALMLLLFIPILIPQTPEKPLYNSTGNEATLIGVITLKGTPSKPMQFDMTADPVCIDLNKTPATDPSILLNDDKLLIAFVYVMGESLSAHRFELPDSQVILQRVNCQFAPRVLAMRLGQSLLVANNDPTHHNTHPTPRINQEWNQTQPPHSPPLVKTFKHEEAVIPFKCNQHPWEKAFVAVMNHPFFAVTNELGSYEISGLPPGTYKLVGWHEAFDEQELEVTLAPGETRRVDFIFDLENGLKKTYQYSQRGSETP